MADPVTWQSLSTVLGASAGSIAVVQFAKVVFDDMSAAIQRRLSALLGLVIVEIAVLAMNGPGLLDLSLGFFVGIQAGLAASKTFEIATRGIDHQVTRKP